MKLTLIDAAFIMKPTLTNNDACIAKLMFIDIACIIRLTLIDVSCIIKPMLIEIACIIELTLIDCLYYEAGIDRC